MDMGRFCSRQRASSITEGAASSHPATKAQAVHTSDSDCQAPIAYQDKKSTKTEKKKVYESHLSYRKESEQAHGCIVLCLQKVCFVVSAKCMETHQYSENQGPQGEFVTGIMQGRSYGRAW